MMKDRLFPTEQGTRKIARQLYERIESLPIISPHGHTNPSWFAKDQHFSNPTDLFVTPDHYVYRMLFSQGVEFSELGFKLDGCLKIEKAPKEIWKIFAKYYYLFRGTPTRMWLDFVFESLFGIEQTLSENNAEFYYETIDELLKSSDFKPRALFDKFNIEVLSTTDNPLSDLFWHKEIANSDWGGRIIPAYRPDNIIDPANNNFLEDILKLGAITGENTERFSGYLAAHFSRRNFFKSMGATSTDHGHPTANTARVSKPEIESLFDRALQGRLTNEEAEKFRSHMLFEMAKMSIEDGLVMQLHPGSFRNHSPFILKSFGPDRGFDIPSKTDYVQSLKPLLDELGLDKRLTLILFTLDESALSRELAPLCGVYPCLKLGPPWWFFDSVEGMKRFRRAVTETAGFYNTVGFNDDTRAFCSIRARHDMARRVDCAYLSDLVVSGQISEEEGHELAYQLSYALAKESYKL